MNQYQQYIHLSRYARWIPELNRRETWDETVTRYIQYFADKYPTQLTTEVQANLYSYIYDLGVMPSMRCLMTAGPALDIDNVAGYNCSYLAVDSVRAFDEAMYILMCGTGVGFSVERQYVNNLPDLPESLHDTDTTIVVKDSKIGWAKSYRELLSMLYTGHIPKWDISKVRAAGSRLKTFGGRASGPQPLVDLFTFTIETFKRAVKEKKRKLSSIDCHDLMCKVADIVVVGGVRRSALISLSNLTDERMRYAKSGQWWDDNSQRALANNSVCYTEKPDMAAFMREWSSLYESRSGERGIFNRVASQEQAGKNGRRDPSFDFGTNPCSEIILRNGQFCNLTEVVVRESDTLDSLLLKVEAASILGTLQSTLTDFRYLRSHWTTNTEEERLLGVSLTGILDHPVLSGTNMETSWQHKHWLSKMKEKAIETNKVWADKLGIQASTAITCVKPSGTVSQLVDSASGIHPRYSPYYIRTVRADKKDPLAQMMKDKGFPCEEDVMKPSNLVFSFPQKAPDSSVFRNDMTAIEQLELWKIYQENWCEHKPSITVYVREHEWMEVGAWVYKHFDVVSGVSFLPYSDHVYKQAPYQECSKEEYELALTKVPDVDLAEELSKVETEDNTVNTKELACSAGVCEI